jgi:hypothetical protein
VCPLCPLWNFGKFDDSGGDGMKGKTFLYIAIGLAVVYFIYKEYVSSTAAATAAAVKVQQQSSTLNQVMTGLNDVGGIAGLEEDFGFGGSGS